MRIGIVGVGHIGFWLAKLLLSRGFEVGVYDISEEAVGKALKLGAARYGSLENLALHSDHVVVATPLAAILDVLGRLRRLAARGALRETVIYDTSTFKLEVMEAYSGFPGTVRVSSIHPLFGAGASGPGSHVVAIIPVPGREADSRPVEGFYRSLGFKTVTVDPSRHDRIVSLTIGLSHIIGVALASLVEEAGGPREVEALAGPPFRLLSMHYKSVLLDSSSLLGEILSKGEVRGYVEELAEILGEALERPEAFAGRAAKLRGLWGVDVLERAYISLYRCVEGSRADPGGRRRRRGAPVAVSRP